MTHSVLNVLSVIGILGALTVCSHSTPSAHGEMFSLLLFSMLLTVTVSNLSQCLTAVGFILFSV